MRFISLILTIFIISFTNCNKIEGEITESSTQKEDDDYLEMLYDEISEMAEKYDCDNASKWRFTAIGAKACGGPVEYIAFSNKINTKLFLKKVELFTEQQAIYNKKWGIISDCSIPPEPEDVICENGKPKFIY
jgi:hypothetical protein